LTTSKLSNNRYLRLSSFLNPIALMAGLLITVTGTTSVQCQTQMVTDSWPAKNLKVGLDMSLSQKPQYRPTQQIDRARRHRIGGGSLGRCVSS
jgi:hypothetical protein